MTERERAEWLCTEFGKKFDEIVLQVLIDAISPPEYWMYKLDIARRFPDEKFYRHLIEYVQGGIIHPTTAKMAMRELKRLIGQLAKFEKRKQRESA